MASSADAATATPGPRTRRRGWKSWLLLGVCFGLGYGITHRLLALRFDTGLNGRQRFEVKPSPGTELDSLRRRFGDASMQIRGDLDLLELERQQKRESSEIERRREAIEERERRQQQDDRPAPTPAEAAADADVTLPPLPEPPVLPPEPAAAPEPQAPSPTP